MKTKLCVLFFLFIFSPAVVFSGIPQISGSSATSFLGFKTDEAHYNFYQHVSLAYRPEFVRNFSIHINLMGLTDLGPASVGTPFQVYGAYFDWRHLWKNRLNVSLGRKFYFNGVGVGYLDGGFLSVRALKKIRFSFFGGVEVPYNRAPKVYRLQDGYVIGGKVQVKNVYKTRLGISFYRKVRNHAAYWQLVGLDLSRPFGHTLFWHARTSFNLLESSLRKALVNLRWLPSKKLLFYLEGFYRTPQVYHDSFFERFELEGLTQGRLNAVYYFSKKYGLTGDLLWIFTGEKQSQKFRLGVLTPYGILGFQQDLGFAGFQIRAYADVRYPVTEALKVRLLLDYSNYQISDWSESYIQFGSAFRLEYQIKERFLISLEDQFYNNRLYKVDNRILGQVICRF